MGSNILHERFPKVKIAGSTTPSPAAGSAIADLSLVLGNAPLATGMRNIF